MRQKLQFVVILFLCFCGYLVLADLKQNKVIVTTNATDTASKPPNGYVEVTGGIIFQSNSSTQTTASAGGSVTLTNTGAGAGVVNGSGSTWGVGTNVTAVTGQTNGYTSIVFSNASSFASSTVTNFNVAVLGTAAYSNSTAFAPSTVTNFNVAVLGTAAYSNSTAFAPASGTNIIDTLAATLTAGNHSGTTDIVLDSVNATQSHSLFMATTTSTGEVRFVKTDEYVGFQGSHSGVSGLFPTITNFTTLVDGQFLRTSGSSNQFAYWDTLPAETDPVWTAEKAGYVQTNAALDKLRINDGSSLTNIPASGVVAPGSSGQVIYNNVGALAGADVVVTNQLGNAQTIFGYAQSASNSTMISAHKDVQVMVVSTNVTPFGMVRYQNTAAGAGFTGMKSRGTAAAPLAVLLNDNLMRLNAVGYYGTNWPVANCGGINFKAAENFSPTNQGLYIVFNTTQTNNAATDTERMRLTSEGELLVGTTTGNGNKLRVAGMIESTSGGYTFPDATVQITAAITNLTTAAAPGSSGQVIYNNAGVLAGADVVVTNISGGIQVMIMASQTASNALVASNVMNISPLTIVTTNNAAMSQVRYQSAAGGAGINFAKSRGSPSAPTVANANDRIFEMNGLTWTGTNWVQSGWYRFFDAEAQTLTNGGSYHAWATTGTNTAANLGTERMRLTSEGQLLVGTQTGNTATNGGIRAANIIESTSGGFTFPNAASQITPAFATNVTGTADGSGIFTVYAPWTVLNAVCTLKTNVARYATVSLRATNQVNFTIWVPAGTAAASEAYEANLYLSP